MFKSNPEIVSVIFISVLLGAIFLGIVGLICANLFSKAINVSDDLLIPSVVILCVLCVFAMRSTLFDIGVMIAAGVLGYAFRKANIPLAPLLLGFILGPMFEGNLRRAMVVNYGSLSGFITRPASLFIIGLAIVLTVTGIMKEKKRQGNASS